MVSSSQGRMLLLFLCLLNREQCWYNMLRMFPNQVWCCVHRNLHPRDYNHPLHLELLLVLERISPLVVYFGLPRVPPSIARCRQLRHLLVHQGHQNHKITFMELPASCFDLNLPSVRMVIDLLHCSLQETRFLSRTR